MADAQQNKQTTIVAPRSRFPPRERQGRRAPDVDIRTARDHAVAVFAPRSGYEPLLLGVA
jgi:hypothetical protein